MDNLKSARLLLGKDSLRDLVRRESKLPTHEKTFYDLHRSMERAKIPENVRWNYGRPQIPDQPESIFNFSSMGAYPHAYLAPFDQPITQRGVQDSMRSTGSLGPKHLQDMLAQAKAGAKAGRWAWYDMAPIHDFVHNEMSPEDAEHVQRFLKMGVPLSQQTSVPAEILGSLYLNRIAKQEGESALVPNDDTLGFARYGGGASPADKMMRARRMLQGEPLPETAPKLAAYEQNRAGNLYPATVDSKMLNLVGMDSKAKPAQKGQVAALLKSMGARTGIEPAKLQASLWGEGQGLKTTAGAEEPYAAVLNNMLYRAAQKEGIDPKRYAIEALSGERHIPFQAKELGYAGGGKVSPLRFVDYLKQFPKRDRFAALTEKPMTDITGENEMFAKLGSERSPLQFVGGFPDNKVKNPMFVPRSRRRFFGYDTSRPNEEGSAQEVGSIAANWGDKWKAQDLIDIDIQKAMQQQGYGKETLALLLSQQKNEKARFPLWDVKRSAKKYWESLGAQMEKPDQPFRQKEKMVYDRSGMLNPEASEQRNNNYYITPGDFLENFAGGGKVRGMLAHLADQMEGSMQMRANDSAAMRHIDNPIALRAYLAKQAPPEWTDSLLQSRDPEWEGSGRKTLIANVPGTKGREQAIVKMAQRARGLMENVVADDPAFSDLTKSGNLPSPYYTAPMGDFTITPRQRTDPFALRAHEQMMRPMADQFRNAFAAWGRRHLRGEPSHHSQAHMEDPELQEMMERAGLGGFAKRPLLGGDFFTYKGYKAPVIDAKGRVIPDQFFQADPRVQSTLSKPEMGKGFVLLDEGALLPYLTNKKFERDAEPLFADVLKDRIGTLRDPETAALWDRMQPQPRLPGIESQGDAFRRQAKENYENYHGLANSYDLGFNPSMMKASGGHIKRARMALAGGGAARNWLRGVKGSAIDEALARLKTQRQGTQDIEKHNALDKWIDTNLANYIVKQHGTENDPLKTQNLLAHPAAVRKMTAAEVPERFNKIHEDQGWYGYSKEDRQKYLSPPPWLQKLIDQDQPRHWSQVQFGKAAMEKAGMNPTDKVADMPQSSIEMLQDLKSVKGRLPEQEEKYQRRHQPPIHLHDLDEQTWKHYYEGPIKDTLDFLSHRMSPRREPIIGPDGPVLGPNGEQSYREIIDLKPHELHRMSVADAVRGSQEWHAQMEKKAAQAAALKMSGQGAYKQYPDGWRWIEMGGNDMTKGVVQHEDETYNAIDQQHPDMKLAQQIGKQLGHCYQHPETCADYLSNSKLYSLIDPKGKAHATLEATPGDNTVNFQSFLRGSGEQRALAEEWSKEYRTGLPDTFPQWLRSKRPDLAEELERPNINQIRGPQFEYEHNGKQYPRMMVNDDAKPYVHDFIKSGKWGEVGELEHAGLHEFMMGRGTTYPRGWFNGPNDHLLSVSPEKLGLQPGYYSEEELRKAAQNAYDDMQGFAQGGSVNENPEGNRTDGAPLPFSEAAVERPVHTRDFRWSHVAMQKGGQTPAGFPREGKGEALQRALVSLELLQMEAQDHPEELSLKREIARTEALINQMLGLLTENAKKDMMQETTMASSMANEVTPDMEQDDDDGLAHLLKLMQDDAPEEVANADE